MMLSITGSFLDAWLKPLTAQDPSLVLFLVSLTLAFLTIVVTKYTTNQKALKGLKEKMDGIQKKMKGLQKNVHDKNSQKEMGLLNVELMKISGEQMKHSMRATLFTLIPFILVFGWLSAHYSYSPLTPNQPFHLTLTSMNANIKNLSLEVIPNNLSIINESTQQVAMNNNIQNIYYIRTFTLKGPAGHYTLNFKNGNSTLISKEVIISNLNEYAKPKEVYKDEKITLTLDNKPLKVNLLGIQMSWFWYYFIVTIIFTSIFKKLLHVY